MQPRYSVVLVGFVLMAACLDRKTGNPDAAVPGGADGALVLPGTGGALGGDSAGAPDVRQADGPAVSDLPIPTEPVSPTKIGSRLPSATKFLFQ